VINGITSGLAAISSLGAPLTHRQHAHGVVFVTGHAKLGDSGTDWRQLAAAARVSKLTLVIYMGVSGADHIQNELLTALPANTPVAIIENASLPQQRQALTRLDRLTFTLNETGLKSPSILVVGNVLQACAQIFQAEPSSPTLPLHANI
jgi:uroporphyrin-III C-methyltransferase